MSESDVDDVINAVIHVVPAATEVRA
jgi:hypothetical protein